MGRQPDSTQESRTAPTDVVTRTVAIMRAIHELKEDVLCAPGPQPEFDAGMLEAALVVLRSNVDDDHPLVVAERERQCMALLQRVVTQSPAAREAQAVGYPGISSRDVSVVSDGENKERPQPSPDLQTVIETWRELARMGRSSMGAVASGSESHVSQMATVFALEKCADELADALQGREGKHWRVTSSCCR